MKKVLSFGLALVLFFVLTFPTFAHPGRTASDGCHYCRTNCDYWGVPWNVRHCHGGVTTPIATPPTLIVTPTPKPSPKLTPTPSPTPISTPSPQVESVMTEITPSPSPMPELTANFVVGRLAVGAGALGLGYWGLRRLTRKSKESSREA